MRATPFMLRSFIVFFLCIGLGPDRVQAVEDPPVAVKPAAPHTEMPRVVMVRVGDEEITVQDFMGHINGSAQRLTAAATPAGKVAVLRDMIGTTLLRQAMVKEGLLSPEIGGRAMLSKGYRKLAERHFPLPPTPDDAEVRQYYDDHPQYFGIPPMVRISHIQFRVPIDATEEWRPKSLARAEAALGRLKAGEPFSKLAAELSDDENSRQQGGDAGFRDRGLPWLQKALEGVAVGQHTGIVESPAGYEILLLTEAREALVRPYEDVKISAGKRMRGEAQARTRQAYIKELAAKTEIVMEMEELERARP